MVLAVEVVVAVLLLVGVAFAATRRDVASLDDVEPDRNDLRLPTDRPLRSEDLDRVRLRVVQGWHGVRGYRFDDVDAVLAAAADALRGHERAAGQGEQQGEPAAEQPPPAAPR